MSKRLALFAKDLRPGDKVRLVYEIVVDSIDDLDTVIPSESSNLFFIKGTVEKGPMRGMSGQFAIYGEDKLDVLLRKSFRLSFAKFFSGWFHPSEKSSKAKSKSKA